MKLIEHTKLFGIKTKIKNNLYLNKSKTQKSKATEKTVTLDF